MRALPDVTVLCPGDLVEAKAVTKAIASYPGTCYVRLGRGGEKKIHPDNIDFEIGKAIKVQDGEEIAIFSTGAIFEEVSEACEILKENGINPTVYTFPTVKPIDEKTIREIAESHKLIVTCEEHNLSGGFGSAVAEVLAELPAHARLLRMGMNDQYCTIVGDQKYLRDQYGISGKKIAEKILHEVK